MLFPELNRKRNKKVRKKDRKKRTKQKSRHILLNLGEER